MVLGVMCLQDYNNIEDEGCRYLGPALAECKALSTLSLVRDGWFGYFVCDDGCVSAPVIVWLCGACARN
jgi:hypothetical protein